MTQTELTRMMTWIDEHVEMTVAKDAKGTFYVTNKNLSKDFYEHFKAEIN